MGHNGTIASLFVNSAVLYKMFSALHGMPARTSYEKGVCLSVCPRSYAWIVTKRKKHLSIRKII